MYLLQTCWPSVALPLVTAVLLRQSAPRRSPMVAVLHFWRTLHPALIGSAGSQRWQRKAQRNSAQADSDSEAELAAAEVTGCHGYGHC